MPSRYGAVGATYVWPFAQRPLIGGALTLLGAWIILRLFVPTTDAAGVATFQLFACVAFTAWFAGCLAARVREQIGDGHRALVPRFRETHLAVGLLVAVVVVLTATVILCAIGVTFLGGLALSFAYCAAFLWVGHVFFTTVGPWALLGTSVLALLWLFSATWQQAMGAVARGPSLPGAATIIVASAVAATIWAWRALRLHAEMFEYRSIDFDVFRVESPSWCVERKLARLSSLARAGTWRRVQLWRLGQNPTAPGWGAVRAFVMAAALHLADATHVSLYLFPFLLVWKPIPRAWSTGDRGVDLGWESLRPCVKPQFFCELGSAAVLDTLQAWTAMLVAWLAFASLWTPEIFATGALPIALLFSLGTVALSFGLYSIGIVLAPRVVAAAFFRVMAGTGQLALGLGLAYAFGRQRELLSPTPERAALALGMVGLGVLLARRAHLRSWWTELG